MSITLDTLFRDVNARLTDLNLRDQIIETTDVIRAINDAIRELRSEYIKNGAFERFITTTTLTGFTEDSDYPFLLSVTLGDELHEDLPISYSVYNLTAYFTDQELTDTTQTWTAGDYAYKGRDVYIALEDISSTNTYDLTFETEDVRNWYSNNGLVYANGDIVYDPSTGEYWRATQEYTNNQGETLSGSGAFEQLFWKKVGENYINGALMPVQSLHTLKLDKSIPEMFPFSVHNSTVYTREDKKVSFSYVPQWTEIEDRSANIDLPDTMFPAIKDRAIQKLAQKLGFQVPNESNE